MKGFLAFLEFCAYILGVIGGFFYAACNGSVPIGLCILALGVMAWPEFKKACDILKGNLKSKFQ